MMRRLLAYALTAVLLVAPVNLCGCSTSAPNASNDMMASDALNSANGTSPSGTENATTSEDSMILVYDMNRERTQLVAVPFTPQKTVEEDGLQNCVKEVLQRVITGPGNAETVPAISEKISAVTFSISEGCVSVDFSKEYMDTPAGEAVLRRAAVVKSLCALEDILGVYFTVDGAPIEDSKGVPIGLMVPEQFLENDGSEINSYERADLHLFFADESGTGLVETVESVVYSSNISMEKLVAEYIVKGPITGNVYPVVSSELHTPTVTVKDGTCYVNFTQDYLEKTLNVSDEVLLYSFVNSLTQLSNVSRVQFMVDSETEISFGTMYLSTPFERNLELIR